MLKKDEKLGLAGLVRRSPKGEDGFTLIEIMIVLAIVGLLFSFVGASVMKKFKESKVQAARIQIASFEQALQGYYLAHNIFPNTAQGLEALIQKPSVGKVPDNWQGPYISKNTLPKDPFGNPYRYQCENYQEYKITSDGPDQEPGTGDDVASDAASVN
jgi:general secretion pathway protein G